VLRQLLIFCVCGLLCVLGYAEQSETRRVALVVGNGDYAEHPLGNAANDARAMSNALGRRGFEVISYRDLNRVQMHAAVREFRQRLGEDGVGVFYFAGHGMQSDGKTWLAPVDVDLAMPTRMPEQGIELQTMLGSMPVPRNGGASLVILDMCLNGLAPAADMIKLPIPEQTLIAFATAPGKFAADGTQHGVFTAALLNAIRAPDAALETVLAQASATVRHASGGAQSPWIASSLRPGFRFAKPSEPEGGLLDTTVAALESRGILPKDASEQYELSFWESIKDSEHVSDYEAYLQAYPNGRFAGLARARIERLRAAAPKPAAPETPAAKTPAPTPPPSATPTPAPAPAQKPPVEQARPAPAPKQPEQAKPAQPPKPPVEKPADRPPEQARPAAPLAPKVDKPGSVPAVSEIQDCPTCPVLISMPRGAFTMGSNSGDPSEKPAHQVSINKPFAIGKYEVTVEQWNACVAASGCTAVGGDGTVAKNMPIRDVSWEDAQQYVKWLSKVSGKPYRLPTEAEWEYAARGGTSTKFWWGEEMRSGAANCKECGQPWNKDGPTPVGTFAPNPFGLYDMNGSVWEWVADCWHNTFKGAPSDGGVWDDPNCRVRVIRGGSWREGASYMPSSTRFKYDVSVRHTQNGFRVARELK
jgi:formylglycine-generating enzyme required for sulfatase activity